MQETKVDYGADSDIYISNINGQKQIRKEYYTQDMSMILNYHRIQNRYANERIKAKLINNLDANKSIEIQNFSRYFLYKGEAIKAISFSILYLGTEDISRGSNTKTKKEHVFTTPKYIEGDSIWDAERKNELIYTPLLHTSALHDKAPFDRDPGCAIEDGIYSALARKYPIFKKMATKDDMISRNLCCRKNIKIISFENGNLELCITDLGGSIKEFVKNYNCCV